MENFPNQTGDFNYTFEVNPKTGVYEWSFSLGNKTGSSSYFENPEFVQNLQGDFNQSYAISKDAEYLAVGDPELRTVEVYENFNKINELTGNGLSRLSGFGRTVYLDNGNLFVGAPEANDGSGACFVFQDYIANGDGATGSSNWGQKTFISGIKPNGNFGCSHHSIINNLEYITAIGATGQDQGSGAVYLYDQTLSTFLKEITPEDNNVQFFGRSVCLTSVENIKYLAVGYEEGGMGKVKMYKESLPGLLDFNSYRTISSDSPTNGNLFGYSIDASQDYIMIGEPNGGMGWTPAVHFLKYNTDLGIFETKQKINSPDFLSGSEFGKNISFENDNGIITSNYFDTNYTGKAYIYQRNNNTWSKISEISGTSNSQEKSFGGDVLGSRNTVIKDNFIIIGSSKESQTYIYTTGAETFQSGISFSVSGVEGKLYDNDNNFIFGYEPNEKFTISGNVFSGSSNIFINNSLYNSNVSRETGNINAWEISGADNLGMYSFSVYDVNK